MGYLPVAALAGNQQTLGVYYYDEVQEQWERQRSIVDTKDATVSFTTNHFSRYALGFVDDEVYTENLFDALRETITESSLHRVMKKMLVRKVNLAERLAKKDRRGTNVAANRLLKYVDRTAERLGWFGKMNVAEAAEMHVLVQRILMVIR